MRIALAFVVGALALGLPGCMDDNPAMSETTPEDPASAPLSRSETIACLRSEGADVERLQASNEELRALRDLAQDRSFEIRVDGREVAGLAINRDIAGAELLAELLAVPNSPYEVVRRGNAVMVLLGGETSLPDPLAACFTD